MNKLSQSHDDNLFTPDELSILPIINDWNSTEADYPRDQCVQQLFERTASMVPDNFAVIEAWGKKHIVR